MFRLGPVIALVVGIELTTYTGHPHSTLEPDETLREEAPERTNLITGVSFRADGRLRLHKRHGKHEHSAESTMEEAIVLTPVVHELSFVQRSQAPDPAASDITIIPAAQTPAAQKIAPPAAAATGTLPANAQDVDIESQKANCLDLMNSVTDVKMKEAALLFCDIAYRGAMETRSGDKALIATHDLGENQNQADLDSRNLKESLKSMDTDPEIPDFAAVGSLIAVFMLLA